MGGMDAAKHDLIAGLGLCVLAVLFTGALLTASVVALGNANYLRAAGFGIPGLVAAYWTVRFTLAQLAGYRATREEQQARRRDE
jgi:uncharacterized membrane protein